MNYYYLMAGAPELRLSDVQTALTLEDFRAQLDEQLSGRDKALLDEWCFLEQDYRNVAALLEDAGAELPFAGCLNRSELEGLIACARDEDYKAQGRVQKQLVDFVRQYDAHHQDEGFFAHDVALYRFLSHAARHCPNRMMRRWFTLNLNVNNVLTALLAKRHGWDAARYVMGEGEVQDTIRAHAAEPDLGLGFELEYMHQLSRIVQEDDPVEKERMIDALRWTWLEDTTFFTTFGIENVFSYLVRLGIKARWAGLDVEQGRKRFEEIIDNLRGEARVPQEFVR